MSEKANQKLVKCGCGGEAEVCKSPLKYGYCYFVKCERCETATNIFVKVEEAIEAWNKAMGAEKMPTTNMTILHRKIDLLSILQAIKSDKIRVWMNFDGKICFRNTKTGNEISVYPYYDMNGEKFDD